MIGWLLLGWSLTVWAISVAAIARARDRWRAVSRAALDAELAAPARKCAFSTIVRPCAGDEPHLFTSLRSSIHANELGRGVRVVFAVESRADGAWTTIERVVAELRDEGVEAHVVETHTTALNAKSGQLAAALREHPARADDELLVFCDSDVELRSGDLIALTRPILEGEIGCCWAPPYERVASRARGDMASEALLGGSLHAFVLLAGLDRAGLVGKLFSLRAADLARVGGFSSLLDVLGEDMEIARLLREAGVSIGVSPRAARSLASGRSASAALERYTRWLQVIRAQRPLLLLSYPALFFATPLILIGALLLAMYDPLLAFSSAAIAIATRLTVALAAREATDRSHVHQDIWVDAILSDLLLAMSFFQTLSRSHVLWRGRRLSLSKGRLVPAVSRAARFIAVFAMVAGLSIPYAFALPKAGDQGLNARLEDADGKVTELKQFRGKPILIVYENKDASKQNEALKKELAVLAKGDKYKDKVALAAVADLDGYNYWPVKGFVIDAIKQESKKAGTTIFCDWDAGVRGVYGFKKGTSSIVLIDKNGWVIFSQEGTLSAEARARLVELLRQQVE